jgi:hypothetical protein
VILENERRRSEMSIQPEMYTSAKFYVTYTDGYRYVFTTGVDGLAENIAVTYEVWNEDAGEYIEKPLGDYINYFDNDDNLFLEVLKRARDYAVWSRRYDC